MFKLKNILFITCAICCFNVKAAVLIKLVNCSESQARYQLSEQNKVIEQNQLLVGESKEVTLHTDFGNPGAKNNQDLQVTYRLNGKNITSVILPAHHRMCSHIYGISKKCFDFDYTPYISEPLPLFLCTMKGGYGTTAKITTQTK